MKREGAPLGPLEHAVGGLLALVVLVFTAEIATAASSAMTWLVNALGGGVSLGFMLLEGHGPAWSVLGGLALLGGIVVGFDALVRRDLIRPWVPPLAVSGLACAAFTLFIANQDTEWREAAIMGTGLGAVVGCSFSVWWCGAAGTARMRQARAAVRGVERAG